MGLRGPGARTVKRPKAAAAANTAAAGTVLPRVPALSRAEKIVAFVESLPCTAGQWAGTTFKLRDWQRRELLEIYRTDAVGRRAVRRVCWSTARGNGKTGLAAVLALA